MRLLLATLAVGIAIPACLPLSGAPWMRYLLPLAVLLLLLSCWCQRHGLQRRGLVFLMCLLALGAGMLWTLTRAGLHHHRLLPEALAGVDLWVVGDIVSLPQHYSRSQQFELHIVSACFQLRPEDCYRERADDAWLPYHRALEGRRVSLNSYDASLSLHAGERWRLRVRLQQPRGLVNPAGIDGEARNFQRGISARGHVRETSLNQRLGLKTLSYQRWRQELRERVRDLPVAEQEKALLLALVIGDRTALSDAQWRTFTATGTNHLVVISGLHIGFVTAMVYALVAWLVRLSPSLLLRIPAQRLAAPAAMLAAVLYAMLAGFLLPTQRALIMVLVAMTAVWLAQRHVFSLGLILALVVVLLRDPLSVLDAGFWLSFSAVAALLWVFGGDWQPGPGRRKLTWSRRGWRFWQRWVRPQWVVFVVLFVPLSVFIGEVSLLAPLANVLAIPLLSLWVVPLALLAAISQGWWAALSLMLFELAAGGLRLLQRLLESMLQLAGEQSSIMLPGLPWPVLLFSAVAAALLLLPPGWPARYLFLPLLLPLLVSVGTDQAVQGRGVLPQGQARLMLLDAGQGLAVVVHTAGHVMVYDTGPGANVVGPYLQQLGRRSIDTLIISHWHQDHSGGLPVLLERFAVNRKLAGRADSSAPGFEPCQQGMYWQADGVLFEVLHPDGRRYRGENDNSCVLRISAGDHRLLLTGDIEQAAERDLLRQAGDQLAAQVMLAPHHGSASSSSVALLEAVSPQWVLYSAGHQNRFGHPSALVVERVLTRGAMLLGTPGAGAISMRLGEQVSDLSPLQLRADRPRYWRLP